MDLLYLSGLVALVALSFSLILGCEKLQLKLQRHRHHGG